MKLLLDTSIIIDYIRRADNPNAPLAKISRKYESYSISDITLAELFSGKYIWDSRIKMNQLKSILKNISRLSTNEKISILAGQIRSKTNIALLDCLIAATAIEHKLPLATLNTKDFSLIAHLKLIKL